MGSLGSLFLLMGLLWLGFMLLASKIPMLRTLHSAFWKILIKVL